MTRAALSRDEAIRRLQQAEPEIRSLGVARLALFGSVLRDQANPDSDVDILVEFAPGTKSFAHLLTLFDLLEERLGQRVEVVTIEALSPFLGPRILAEAQDVFRAA
ncbi:MAG: nucleotidyltransferase family protein [Trueperaceae bacterium]